MPTGWQERLDASCLRRIETRRPELWTRLLFIWSICGRAFNRKLLSTIATLERLSAAGIVLQQPRKWTSKCP